jgi:hypothetical protein
VNEVGEVEFQYIANMHGDEVVGRELSLYFIYHLCDQYHQPRIKAIVDNTDIHILPTMNPDGACVRRAPSFSADLVLDSRLCRRTTCQRPPQGSEQKLP